MTNLKHYLNIIISLIKEIGIIILYLLLITFLALIFKDSLNQNNLILYNLSNILINLIVLIIFIYIFKREIIPKWYDYKKNYSKYLKNTYIYYIIGLFIMIISLNIITRFYNMPNNEIINQNELLIAPLYSIFSVLIIAPVVEELLTRIILKDAFKNKYIYALFSGLIFATLHVLASLINQNYYELLYIIPYGALGFMFALIYSKTNNIWTNITYHSFHNLLCLLLFFGGF